MLSSRDWPALFIVVPHSLSSFLTLSQLPNLIASHLLSRSILSRREHARHGCPGARQARDGSRGCARACFPAPPRPRPPPSAVGSARRHTAPAPLPLRQPRDRGQRPRLPPSACRSLAQPRPEHLDGAGRRSWAGMEWVNEIQICSRAEVRTSCGGGRPWGSCVGPESGFCADYSSSLFALVRFLDTLAVAFFVLWMVLTFWGFVLHLLSSSSGRPQGPNAAVVGCNGTGRPWEHRPRVSAPTPLPTHSTASAPSGGRGGAGASGAPGRLPARPPTLATDKARWRPLRRSVSPNRRRRSNWQRGGTSSSTPSSLHSAAVPAARRRRPSLSTALLSRRLSHATVPVIERVGDGGQWLYNPRTRRGVPSEVAARLGGPRRGNPARASSGVVARARLRLLLIPCQVRQILDQIHGMCG